MSPLMMTLFMGILAAVFAVLIPVLKKRRGSSEKYQQIMADFKEQVSAMLEEGETVEAVCGYKPCAAVTTRRLLVSSKNGIDVVPFGEIKKLQGMDGGGNKTAHPDRMIVFEIKAAKKYVLGNHSEGFSKVVNRLKFYTGK